MIAILSVPWFTAGAVPTWPALDTDWNPVLVGGNVYLDALANSGSDNFDTPPPEPMDIVGGIDQSGNGPFAAGFWAQNATELMFRMRVDNNPSVGGQFVWTTLLNTDADSGRGLGGAARSVGRQPGGTGSGAVRRTGHQLGRDPCGPSPYDRLR